MFGHNFMSMLGAKSNIYFFFYSLRNMMEKDIQKTNKKKLTEEISIVVRTNSFITFGGQS